MKRLLVPIVAFLGVMLMTPTFAEPTRDALVEAWETHMASLPGTVEFEASGDESWRIKDENLPYEGNLELVGVVVRPAEELGDFSDFTHTGMVEFRLTDLSEGRTESQSYYYWLSDRQMMYYDGNQGVWLNTAEYRDSFNDMYDVPGSWGLLSFMLNYGIWIVLLALFIWIFTGLNKQNKKARALMDDGANINQLARENLERSAKLQDELLESARKSQQLNMESNELLKEILAELRKGR